MLPQINNAKQVLNMLKSSNNPQMLIQQVIQNNPRANEINSLLNSINGDYNALFYRLCEQKGINPQEFLEALNSGF